MTRAKQLHQNKGHERAENTVFVKRMRFKTEGDVALKSDCINLAIQYVSVYQALEARLQQLCLDEKSCLAVFTKEPWAGRSRHLQDDVIEMKSFLSPEEQSCLINDDHLFPATQNMIADIERADTVELFSWLMVRCLGDAFGGQGLKVHNQKIFGDNQLTAHFANGVSSEAGALVKIVNQTALNEEEPVFFTTADLVFQLHVELFEEMERDRVVPEITVKQQIAQTEQQKEITQKKPAQAGYSNGCKFLMFATLAAGVAIPIVSAYCASTSPQK